MKGASKREPSAWNTVMGRWLPILLHLLGRDLWPASESTGPRQWFAYRVPVALLPSFGVVFILFVASVIGLGIVGAQHGLQERLKRLQTSPYMALFGEGFLYDQTAGNDQECEASNRAQLCWWRRAKVDDLFRGKPQGGEGADHSYQGEVFSGVYPFRWGWLGIRNKNGENLRYQKGMILEFIGGKTDVALIQEIGRNLRYGRLFNTNDEEGLLLTCRALDLFGWHNCTQPPPYLSVRLDFLQRPKTKTQHIAQDKEIPLPIVGIVDQLPYSDLLMTSGQLLRLDQDYYFEPIAEFELGFRAGVCEQETQAVKASPLVQEVGTCVTVGTTPTVRVSLKALLPRLDILKEFIWPFGEHRQAWLGSPSVPLGEGFNGAIFHLDTRLLQSGDFDFLVSLQEFMEDVGINVRGELIQALKESFDAQSRLHTMSIGFRWGMLPAIGMILLVLFSLVLHTRLHRIGTLRMLGMPDMMFLVLYGVESICLVLVTFGIAGIGLVWWRPLGIPLDLFRGDVLWLLGQILLWAVFGFVGPAVYFFFLLQPAEMVAYRN